MHSDCRRCTAGLEHCHGTVIRHPLRHAECTDGACAGPELASHEFVVDCDATGCPCAQPTAHPIGSAVSSASLRSG